MPKTFVKNLYYLGPDGSNSHLAAMKAAELFEIGGVNYIPKRSIKQALLSTVGDNSAFCILPCENSIEGIVRETVDNMLNISDPSIAIRSEIVLPVKHCLLSNAKNKSDIKLIISHPQALAQCNSFLFNNYPEIPVQEVSSTSYAAEKAAREGNSDIAAIANEACQKIYNLNIIENEINDEKFNQTRFFLIGRTPVMQKKKGKTALILQTKNRPGALYNVLKIFSDYNINLTCIDSRPQKKKPGEYSFYMDFEGKTGEEQTDKALTDLTGFTDFVKILGSFSSFK